ncbi:hypothetical protein SADUNF_Sadunf01G0057800 [Salix dunnii]|uniref:Uncharacterized protein n=1 Tax=Salix dunnii TaxID=1413687 RepID=A0A835N9X4_9ROSI|nr:hypothetical protein SADUNF_Sadunf01G0057800 [Salix dunnii]
MVLRAIGEENEQIESENDSMMRELQLMQDDMEMQKTESCASQNKIIAAQEICVKTLYQKLQLMQDDMEKQKTESCASQNKIIAAQEICVKTLYQKLQLMGGSDRLDVAPSNGNQSLDDITELKHRSMLSTKNIDLLCEMLLK